MNKEKITMVLALSLALVISGCSLFGIEGHTKQDIATMSNIKQDFETALATITLKYSTLDKEGGAWSTTEEQLRNVTEAAKSNDFEQAMKMLKNVNSHIDLARTQFEE